MAEVLVTFESEFKGADGLLYQARACARERLDRLWEGWLEFTPVAGGTALRTGRETTQPNRDDVVYWATGLTTTYLEGALERALAPPLPSLRAREVRSQPAYDEPARFVHEPVLNPFDVYREGADILRAQLNALDEAQLRIIATAFAVADPDEVAIANRAELISLILVAAEQRSVN